MFNWITWPPSVVMVLVALVLFGGVFLLIRRWRRHHIPKGTWLVVKLKGAITDLPQPIRRFFPRRLPPDQIETVARLRQITRAAAKDPHVVGLLVRIEGTATGWATATSIRETLGELQSSGKRVVSYLPYGAMSLEMYIASGTQRVLASPQTEIAPNGIYSGRTFYRSVLNKLGVEPEAIAYREYKGAVESYTRDDYSEPNRQQTEELLDGLYQSLVTAIRDGRSISEENARNLVDKGLLRANEAVTAKLIDAVAYDDEIAARLNTKPEQILPVGSYGQPGFFKRFHRGKVGVVSVRGAIITEAGMVFGQAADSKSIINTLRLARMHPGINAVVLYVNSPGGSALASDLIAREIERIREVKPVVAYFSDVAASGGYYVAAPANEIVAQPTTVTGSIGVFALRFVLQQTLEKLGLNHQIIRRGAHADIQSPYRHWTPEEHALLDQAIGGMYNDFVSIVAKGRKRSVEEIEPLARGRVYTGTEAKKLGLVDHLGGLELAVKRAAMLANIAPDSPAVIVPTPKITPPPAAPPPGVEPILQRLGLDMHLINLGLNSEKERLFVFYDQQNS